MVFSTPIFLFAFLPITVVLYYLSSKALRNTVLLITSLIFYAWGEPYAVLLMLGSVLMNYIFGILEDQNKNPTARKAILGIAVAGNLGVLIIFKYLDFIVSSINAVLGVHLPLFHIPLPIGISFFTFHALSYVIDVYRGDGKVQKSYFSLALYISFFPQLIAGPIVRYKDIDSQIRDRSINFKDMTLGIQRFIIGLAKKVLISNVLGQAADQIFAVHTPYWTFGMSWIAIICYTLQIYFDFSAYSDMALGLGHMFGFKIRENFNYPYIAGSIRDFWRRWHISLSSWFRDYLYIPLGGSRAGKVRLYLNQIIVFFLCGLWHGASWNFVIWGLIHGLFLVLERAYLGKRLDRAWAPIQHVYTLLVVMLGWVFFRADTLSGAIDVLQSLFGRGASMAGYNAMQFVTPLLVVTIVIGIIAATGKPFKWFYLFEARFSSGNVNAIYTHIFNAVRMAGLVILFLLSVAAISSGAYNPFIYFKF